LAREANGYTFASLPSAPLPSASFGTGGTGSAGLDRKAPRFQIKENAQAATTTVYVTQSVRVVDNLKTILAPLFKKLDEGVVEEEYARLG
jgi:hypothetical protein